MLTTDQKGTIAELAIALAAVELGVGVYRPYGDERYDLIFDLRPQLVRVQCKWGACHQDVILVRCYRNRRTAHGLLRRTYTRDEIDAFAVYCQQTSRCYFCHSIGCHLRARFNYDSAELGTTNEHGCTGRRTLNSALH